MPQTMRHDFAPVVTYMREHLSEPLHTRDLAHRMHLSQTTFIDHFKAALGQTPYRFLQETRLAVAATLLRTTTLPIAELAQSCGYADQSHFTSEFKRHLGTTPGQYRQHAALQHTVDTLPLVCALWPRVSPTVQQAALAMLQDAATGIDTHGDTPRPHP